MAVGRVVFIAGFAAVSLRVGVLAASGPGVVIIAESTMCGVGPREMACNVQASTILALLHDSNLNAFQTLRPR